MSDNKVGRYIRIINMEGELQYTGKISKILFVDDERQLHGTWGGCAVIPKVDSFEYLSELRTPLFDRCIETHTSLEGINMLVENNINYSKLSEEDVVKYVMSLFDDGTIEEINNLGKGGK